MPSSQTVVFSVIGGLIALWILWPVLRRLYRFAQRSSKCALVFLRTIAVRLRLIWTRLRLSVRANDLVKALFVSLFPAFPAFLCLWYSLPVPSRDRRADRGPVVYGRLPSGIPRECSHRMALDTRSART